MYTEANTSAHGDSVDKGHIWLGVGGDKVVELIFERKVVPRSLLSLLSGCAVLRQHGNITAGAEGSASTLDDDHICHIRLLPFL